MSKVFEREITGPVSSEKVALKTPSPAERVGVRPSDSIFHYPSEFALESGGKLPGFQLNYTTYVS